MVVWLLILTAYHDSEAAVFHDSRARVRGTGIVRVKNATEKKNATTFAILMEIQQFFWNKSSLGCWKPSVNFHLILAIFTSILTDFMEE